MKRLSFKPHRSTAGLALATLLILSSQTAIAGDDKVINQDFEIAQLSQLTLDAHVGSVEVSHSDDDKVHVYVKISESDNWGFFKGSLQEVELAVRQSGTEIHIGLSDDDFGEEWKIEVPGDVAIDVDLGVGEVNISDINANITVDVGVGEVKVNTLAEQFSKVTVDTGVGGSNIDAENGNTSSHRAMVSEESSWAGTGAHHIAIDVGVGDATVKLK